MGDGKSSAGEQSKKMNAFIQSKMSNYRALLKASEKASLRGLSSRYRGLAFQELGRALHAAMDSTSPSHEGFQTFDFLRDMFTHGDMHLSSETRRHAPARLDITKDAMRKVMSGKDL